MTAPRRALVVVDVQQEYFDGSCRSRPHHGRNVANIVGAIDPALAHEMPVVVVQHELPEGSPVFAEGRQLGTSPRDRAAPEPSRKRVSKEMGSVFAGTDVAASLAARRQHHHLRRLHDQQLRPRLRGEAEGLGFAAEILSDASGAIHLANEAGKVSADELPTL